MVYVYQTELPANHVWEYIPYGHISIYGALVVIDRFFHHKKSVHQADDGVDFHRDCGKLSLQSVAEDVRGYDDLEIFN